MRQRKLLAMHVLEDIDKLLQLGVPLAKITRDKRLSMSAMAVGKLVKYNSSLSRTAFDSLHAPWVNQQVTGVQEQPIEWTYEGQFPYGKWVHV